MFTTRTSRKRALYSIVLIALTNAEAVAIGAMLAPIPLVSRTSGQVVLTLRPPRAATRARTPAGNGWRHDFDLVLTTDGERRVVYDESGLPHRFVPTNASVPTRAFLPQGEEETELRLTDGHHIWTRADGSQVTFAGSSPIRLSSPEGGVRELHYENGWLRSVHGTGLDTLELAYRSGRLDALSLSDGTRWKIARDGAGNPVPLRDDAVGECPAENSGCDTDSTPPDPGFEQDAGIPGALRIDARPASCRSYFSDFAGTARGMAIESGFGDLAHYRGYAPTVRSFPIADFIGEELRVVRSRDLSLPTYDAREDGLLHRLLADGEEIAQRLLEPLERHGQLELSELGRTTTLLHQPLRPVVLELVVRHGLASEDQIRQTRLARASLLERHGIVLRVVEIP